MNWMPKLGAARMANKLAVHQGIQSGIFRQGGYILPGQQDRASTRSWRATPRTSDEEVLLSLERLRGASRDLFTNTPVAVAALRRCQTNVVGFGLKLQSRIDHSRLGIEQEAAEEWKRETEEEWEYWCANEADARGTFDFNELQSLAFLSELMNGDVFAAMPWITVPGSIYETRVQLIEADNICNPTGKLDTQSIAGGIQIDQNGRPVNYFLRQPRDMNNSVYMPLVSGYYEWKTIAAIAPKSLRKNILHLFSADRVGQRRGIPFLSPVILPLKNLTRLSESELTAAVVASMFTVFIKNVPAGMQEGFVPGANGTPRAHDAERAANKLYEMGPGSIVHLAQDQSIEIAKPDRPGGTYEPAFHAFVKEIGAALEIPAEVIMENFQSSYSASKAALQEAWKMFRTRRTRHARKFCQPIYENWLWEAVLKGRIKAPGFLDSPFTRYLWSKSSWTGMGPGQLQPDVETKAAGMRIALGLSTNEQEYNEIHGTGDWEGAMRARQEELALMKKFGIQTVNVNGVTVTPSEDPALKEPPGA